MQHLRKIFDKETNARVCVLYMCVIFIKVKKEIQRQALQIGLINPAQAAYVTLKRFISQSSSITRNSLLPIIRGLILRRR